MQAEQNIIRVAKERRNASKCVFSIIRPISWLRCCGINSHKLAKCQSGNSTGFAYSIHGRSTIMARYTADWNEKMSWRHSYIFTGGWGKHEPLLSKNFCYVLDDDKYRRSKIAWLKPTRSRVTRLVWIYHFPSIMSDYLIELSFPKWSNGLCASSNSFIKDRLYGCSDVTRILTLSEE